MEANQKLSFSDWIITTLCLTLVVYSAFIIGFSASEGPDQPAAIAGGVEERYHVWSLETGNHLFVGTLRGSCTPALNQSGLLFYNIQQSSLGRIADKSQRICVLQRSIALVSVNSPNSKWEQVIKP